MCEAWEPLPAALCLHDTTIINVEGRNKTLILKVTVSFKYSLNCGIRQVSIWSMEIHFSRRNIKLWPNLGQRDMMTTADKPLRNTEV